MATEILMPELSPTMQEGALTRWLAAEGDRVRAGDVLCEVETDKATMEYEAEADGVLARILRPAGARGVKVGEPIALLLAEGETPEAPETLAPAAAAAVRRAARMLPCPDWPADAAMKNQTVREALHDALAEEMERDGDVFLLGVEVAEAGGAFHVSQGLLERFGARRVVDMPVAEHGYAGLACGAAFAGLRPVAEFMTFNFAMQAMDHIVNTAAKTPYMSAGAIACPIVFRGPNGAAARVGAQHSQDYGAWYASIPGLKVVQPYSAADAKGLLKAAIRDPNPVVFLESEILYGKSMPVPQADYVAPIGKARIWREGEDVTIVSWGVGMIHALEAAEALSADGIEAEVVDLRTLRPMDTETVVASVMKTNRCVTVEEGFPTCSIGAQISAVLMREAFDHLDAPVLNVTGADVPMPYAENLERLALPYARDVIAAVRAVCHR